MLYEIELKIKDYATLKVFTNYKIIKDNLISENTVIKRTIPITKITCNLIDKKNIIYKDSIIIFNSNKKTMFYDKENNVSVLNAKENEIRFMDLVYISLAMFSKLLTKQNKYLLHSSALLNPSNKAIALVGDANAGKTSLGYELISNYNYKLISNDHSIIGIEDNKVKIFGGTKDIQMRLGACELYFPELYKKIEEHPEDKWNKKIIINEKINQDCILSNDKDISEMSNIYSIVTGNFSESFLKRKDKIDEELFLYESLSKIIKGTYNYITGFEYPMPSMETEEILNNLFKLCKTISDQCKVYEAKGSIKCLAKVLSKQC